MERKFDIVTDSACDMPEEYYKEHNVTCVKLGFTMNNVNYEGEGGEHITEKEFYAKLREGAMPTTYQVTGEMARGRIEASLKNGKDVLVVAFSSGLSGTAGSFVVASRDLAKEYPERKIRIVDSLCASMGQGLLLDYVVKKADTGASLDETADYAEGLKLHIRHYFTVDNLFHLHRGGRVSKTTAIVGSVLKIKPVMHVDNAGKLVAIGKVIGRKKSLHAIVNKIFEDAEMDENDPIFISHGDCMEDVEYVKSLILAKRPNTNILVNYVGSVIGTHSGCGTLAIFNKGKARL
ncbi:MAG: DegV family protein [Clostridia bacterium]|nr:DegV family protein [Clostridia bacterium]